ncbi:MAG: GlmU family protein [Melioribacteraceae bacterium]|jgi:UDP-N-acetylglucosamine diphosphorylase/glucosamine-1-phosphate N-acetyltransferase|nr:GlmU family protein [Melioribacteraceae bacterium]
MIDSICIFEDEGYSNLLPLVYLRPTYELLSGILTLREKITHYFPTENFTLHTQKYLEQFVKSENPSTLVNSLNPESKSCLFINGRVVANKQLVEILNSRNENTLYISNNEVVAANISGENLEIFKTELPEIFSVSDFSNLSVQNIDFQLIKYPWDLVNRNGQEIINDFELLVDKSSKMNKGEVHANATLVNKEKIFIVEGAKIKPGVVLDAELGPIYISKNATVMPNAVIEGPCFIGENSTIKIAAKIYENTSIGQVCKVGGEVEESIIHSYSNKQHDGFLGHAYLGQWVNLGADTNNSDLKNNYGNVKVIINDSEPIDSGSMFVGLIMGDHSKTSINTMINTGTVVGISSNIFGTGFPDKYIPSFSWGGSESLSTYNLEKSISVAKSVMERRNKVFSNVETEIFNEIYRLTQNERNHRNM